LVGDEEVQQGQITLKNMKNGEQQRLSLQEMVEKIL
jgi:histidyl-tRNA synthetase